MDPTAQPFTPPEPQTTPIESKPKGNLTVIILSLLLVSAVSLAGYFYYQNQSLKKMLAEYQSSNQSIGYSSPSSTPIATINPTANWKTYTNIKYNYSIRYPVNLTTQVLAAGAGTIEAPTNADHFYVYDQSSRNSYPERYIEIQPFGQATSYGVEWQRADVKIGNINAAKYTNPDPETFIIYRFAIPNTNGEFEIMVTKNKERDVLANQILSTFEFTN